MGRDPQVGQRVSSERIPTSISEQVRGSLSRATTVPIIVSAVTIASLLLHLALLNSQILSDEPFYIAAAETILNRTSCGPLADLASLQSCNLEHPPLAKLLMAASISAFGDGNLGVRLPSILAGVLSIPLISWIAWRLSGENPKATLAAAILMATSPAWFQLSSVGMLDSIEVFFALLGFAVYFSHNGTDASKRALAAGAVMGLSILSKEDAIYFLAGLALYMLIAGRYKEIVYVLAAATAVVLLGLWAYDVAFTPFTNPFQHILFIVTKDIGLRDQGGYAVSPITWLFQERTALLAVLCLVWIPVAALTIAQKSRGVLGLLPFALVLFVATFGPLALLYYLDGRQEFLFYAVQVVPALVLGGSGLFASKRVPPYALVALAFVSLALFTYSTSHATSVYFVVP